MPLMYLYITTKDSLCEIAQFIIKNQHKYRYGTLGANKHFLAKLNA